MRMLRLRRLWPVLVAVMGLASVTPALAGSFSIAPLRVELGDQRLARALTLRNETDAPVLVQARLVKWSQIEGRDHFEETRDVIVTPAVVTLGARGSQILRVGLRGAVDPRRELSYRLFVQEVPPVADASQRALTVALRLSLPVFVGAAAAKYEPHVGWVGRWESDGSLVLSAENQGTAHLQLYDLALDLGRSSLRLPDAPSNYLLPGARMSWRLPTPAGVDRSTALRIRGASSRGELTAQVSAAGR